MRRYFLEMRNQAVIKTEIRNYERGSQGRGGVGYTTI